MAYAATPIEQRFWPKVDKRGPDECWLWKAKRTKGGAGYGLIYSGVGTVMIYAHRVSWELANGCPVPEGLLVCHSCDNPGCVNPAHLWPGTQSENLMDMVAKGRSHQKRKTHCPQGHEYTWDNLREPKRSKGHRQCATCDRIRQRKPKPALAAAVVVGALLGVLS
jgi:hypothetical protein